MKQFNLGDEVRFKEGQLRELVLITQEQFDFARQVFNYGTKAEASNLSLVEGPSVSTSLGTQRMTVAACRPDLNHMLVLGEGKIGGKFPAGFLPTNELDLA